MIGFEEREIYCNVRNNYEVNEDEYTKIQKKYNELQYNIVNESFAKKTKLKIAPFYFNSQKFLNEKSLDSGITTDKIKKAKLDFGKIAKNFHIIDNIVEQKNFPCRGLDYIQINNKFDVKPNNNNTIFFLSENVSNKFFDTYNYSEKNRIIMDEFEKMEPRDLTDVKNFYIFQVSFDANIDNLTEFANFNFDLVIKYVNYILETKLTEKQYNLFIYTILPITEKYSNLIDELSTKFEDVYVCCANITFRRLFLVIYCKNAIKNEHVQITEKISKQTDSLIKYFNKKIYEVRLKTYYEIVLINKLDYNISKLYEVFGVYQMILLQDSISSLIKNNIPPSKYYLYLLDNLKLENEITNIMKKFPVYLNLLFKSDDGKCEYTLLCKLYQNIQKSVTDKITFKVNIQNIGDDLDIEFLDICSNNFIIHDQITFKCKIQYFAHIEKILKFYNYKYINTSKEKCNLILKDQYDTDYSIMNDRKLGGTLVVRINIFDNTNYKHLELFTSYFTNCDIYAPIFNQIKNNYVYLICNDMHNYKISNVISLEDTLHYYILENKLLMMYYSRLYGSKYFLKQYTKFLLNNI